MQLTNLHMLFSLTLSMRIPVFIAPSTSAKFWSLTSSARLFLLSGMLIEREKVQIRSLNMASEERGQKIKKRTKKSKVKKGKTEQTKFKNIYHFIFLSRNIFLILHPYTESKPCSSINSLWSCPLPYRCLLLTSIFFSILAKSRSVSTSLV